MATTNRNWTEPSVGGSENLWGQSLNTILTSIDAILGTATAISTTGGQTTLTQDQQNTAGIKLSGTLSLPATIVFNGKGGIWVVYNGCAGISETNTVTVKVTGQTGFVVPSGATVLCYCDGTDLVQIGNTIDITGQTDLAEPATDDELLIADTSASGAVRKADLASILALGLVAASQAQQEAASSSAVATTPGVQHYHPSAAKAWGSTDGAPSPALVASHNIASITDNGPGDLTFNFTVPMSSVNYSVSCSFRTGILFTQAALARSIQVVSKTVNGVRIATGYWAGSGGAYEDFPIDFQVFGDM